ncbi:hypothetical protein AALB39_04650 [Lachnospiraceae bacterium 54-53]
MRAEIISSFERDKRHYILLEMEQERHVAVKDDYFITTITSSISKRCPRLEDFTFKCWIKNNEVCFSIVYFDEKYNLKFPVNTCADFNDLDLFELSEEVSLTIFLKDMFAVSKNTSINYKLQLWARCGDAKCKIGDIADFVEL